MWYSNEDFKKRYPFRQNMPYTDRLKWAKRVLATRNKPTYNYELHVPIIFNREKLGQICKVWGSIGAKRSLYGNYFVQESEERNDVKIYDLKSIPPEDADFVSTSNFSFSNGEVGRFLRKKFNRKCKYEEENE